VSDKPVDTVHHRIEPTKFEGLGGPMIGGIAGWHDEGFALVTGAENA
jgi:hypothetical protein